MIDLHTHTFFSDGELIPSELVRRAQAKGYKAIALTDHVDSSNIDFVVPRLAKVAEVLNCHWNIRVIPGAELTHVPIEEIRPLTELARKLGAKIVVCHGETISEPVLLGTNREGILAGADILAHPGLIKEEDVRLARKKGVYLEITTREIHLKTNPHLIDLARQEDAALIVNTDGHCEEDLITDDDAVRFLVKLGLKKAEINQIFSNSKKLLKRVYQC